MPGGSCLRGPATERADVYYCVFFLEAQRCQREEETYEPAKHCKVESDCGYVGTSNPSFAYLAAH